MKERDFHISDREAPMYERYDKAVETNDTKELKWFSQFGSEKREHQMILNAMEYEQYLQCGYTDNPKLDKFGWLKNTRHACLSANIEEINLLRDNGNHVEVSLMELPNGMWINGINYMFSTWGGSYGPSLWREQHPTRLKALETAIKNVMDMIQRNGNDKEKKYTDILKKKMGESRQLSLF